MFLNPNAFRKLEDKLKKELKTGTRVVTFASPLLFWESEKVISLPKIRGKLYLYVVK